MAATAEVAITIDVISWEGDGGVPGPLNGVTTVEELLHFGPSVLNEFFGQFFDPMQNSGRSHSPTAGRHTCFSAAAMIAQLRQHVLTESSHVAPAFRVQLAEQHGLVAQSGSV